MPEYINCSQAPIAQLVAEEAEETHVNMFSTFEQESHFQ